MSEIIASAVFPGIQVIVSATDSGGLRAADGSYTTMNRVMNRIAVEEAVIARKQLKHLSKCFTRVELAEITSGDGSVTEKYTDLMKVARDENRITLCSKCEGAGCGICENYGFYPTYWKTHSKLLDLLSQDKELDKEADAVWDAVPSTSNDYEAHLALVEWARAKKISI